MKPSVIALALSSLCCANSAISEELCSSVFDTSLLPEMLGGVSGGLETGPSGKVLWRTSEPTFLTISWSLDPAPAPFVEAGGPIEEMLTFVCAAGATSCKIEMRDNGTIGIVSQTSETGDADFYFIDAFVGGQRIGLDAITPLGQAERLGPALDTVFDTMIEPMFPPC